MTATQAGNGVPAIRVEALRKQFHKTRALDGVSLDIAQGEFFGLLGPNGAAKPRSSASSRG
jgi:ABC-type multidrug transport system, ATPase component